METAAPHVVAEALLFACAVPSVVVALAGQAPGAALFVFAVAVAHATVLGVPAYLLLRWRRWANLFTAVALGLVAACLPVAVLLFPGSRWFAGLSAWSGGVPLSVNGVATAAGWQSYWHTVALFGGFGAVVGVAFWLYIRLRVRNAT